MAFDFDFDRFQRRKSNTYNDFDSDEFDYEFAEDFDFDEEFDDEDGFAL